MCELEILPREIKVIGIANGNPYKKLSDNYAIIWTVIKLQVTVAILKDSKPMEGNKK